MRYPEFLKPGGTIGFIAPSYGCATEPYVTCFAAALERFRTMGYGTLTGPNCYLAKGVGKSNSPEECGREIDMFFTDNAAKGGTGVPGNCGVGGAVNFSAGGPDGRGGVDAVISCGGGETMCEDLPYVDFEAIAASRPRWFMGYSDNTNLTFTLPVLCDTAAVYGPNAPTFGMKDWHASIDDAFALLTGRKLTFEGFPAWEKESLRSEDDPFAPLNLTEPSLTRVAVPGNAAGDGCANGNCVIGDGCLNGVAIGSGASGVRFASTASFSGRLIGGCLDCLSVLCGTRFDKVKDFYERYKGDGLVWFLEACDLGTMGIRRALWQLREAGWFNGASGFIFGRPLMLALGNDPEGLQEAVLAPLEGLGVPIVLDADIGHTAPSMPLISGAFANVKAGPGQLIVEHVLR
jgi:muramoyltetrapeptide carboxypeptidase LdcA involved in peptidoglycan recycling